MNTVKLTTGGTYTVVTSDCSATNTGNYELYLQRTNNAGGATALTFNQTDAGTIGLATAQNVTYTFTAAANSVVDFTMTATSGSLDPKIRLYNPDGTLNKTASIGFCDPGAGGNEYRHRFQPRELIRYWWVTAATPTQAITSFTVK